MIKVSYNNEGIKVEVGQISKVNKNLPLNLRIRKHVSKEVQWSSDLNDYWIATFPNTEMFDVEIVDSKGKIIYSKKWDIFESGNQFYKWLWLFNKSLISNGKMPIGLVIGTHDGEFGEWVPSVLNRDCKVFLVEASDIQFSKLKENYKKNSLVTPLQHLVTTEGGQVEFFEGGAGYTNSVVENVIKNWETSEIKSTKRDSIAINDLIENICGGNIDWLHLDVEGLDAKLITAIKSTLLPDFIIFEDFNLEENEKNNLIEYLSSQGYSLVSENGISMANR